MQCKGKLGGLQSSLRNGCAILCKQLTRLDTYHPTSMHILIFDGHTYQVNIDVISLAMSKGSDTLQPIHCVFALQSNLLALPRRMDIEE